MVTATKLSRYRDFDRLLIGKNLVITIIGSALAFALAYLHGLIPRTRAFGPPYSLSLSIAIVIVVAVYTRNIASASFVALIAGIAVDSPRNQQIDWILGFIVIVLLLSITLGFLADRLRIVLSWVNFYLYSAIIFVIVIFGFSLTSQSQLHLYDGNNLGKGVTIGSMEKINGVPVFDIIVLGTLIGLILLIKFLTRGQIALDTGSVGKYKVFGAIFLVLGQLFSLITLVLFTTRVSEEQAQAIARKPKQLLTIQDLLSHRGAGPFYGIVEDPMNIYGTIAITVTFTSIGISLWLIGKHRGNLEGMKGGAHTALLAAPIGFLLFMLVGSYALQNLIYPDGFFISIELFPIYATMIWAVFFYNSLLAWIILLVLEKIKSPS